MDSIALSLAVITVSFPDCCHLQSGYLTSPYYSLAADSSRDMTASPFAAAGTTAPGQPQDFIKLFKAERDNLEFAEGIYSWVGSDVESRVLAKYGKIPPPVKSSI